MNETSPNPNNRKSHFDKGPPSPPVDPHPIPPDHDHPPPPPPLGHHPPAGRPPPGHHPPHHPHHRPIPHFFTALKEMLEANHLRNVSDMIAFAAEYAENEIRSILADIAEEDPDQPLELVLSELRLTLEKRIAKAAKERRALLSQYTVGLIPPLPPHVRDEFQVARVTILNPGNHHMDPGWHKFQQQPIVSSRECRARLSELNALAFEGYKHNGTLYIPTAVADVVDYLSGDHTLTLYVHPRPHRHHGDVPTSISKFENLF